MQISRNFHTDELVCPCCRKLEYSHEFIHEKLQPLRTYMGIAFVLAPGAFYRCKSYNEKIGAPKSQHLLGNAADVSTRGWSGVQKMKFLAKAIELGLSVGSYERWFHIDNRSTESVFFHGG